MLQISGGGAASVQLEKLRRQMINGQRDAAATSNVLHVQCEAILAHVMKRSEVQLEPELAQTIRQMGSAVQTHYRQEEGVR